MKQSLPLTFLDFFAGAGLVTEAMRGAFQCVWANDICAKKAKVYEANHGAWHFHLGAIEEAKPRSIPAADLAWASFPCQDLSLAGDLKGLAGTRSGLVWRWLEVIDGLRRAPSVLVAENVGGLASADQGRHYHQLHDALRERGYRAGAVLLGAIHWLPQSRSRVFVVAVKRDMETSALEGFGPGWAQPASIQRLAEGQPEFVCWNLPRPPERREELSDLLQIELPCDSAERTQNLISMLSPRHKKAFDDAKPPAVFPGYRRMRGDQQMLELRFDGISGCLRTPRGGSSRQVLLLKTENEIQSRLLSVREAARLMGLPDSYQIPGSYNDGYKAMGDAVAVPVVRFLAETLLAPLARAPRRTLALAAS